MVPIMQDENSTFTFENQPIFNSSSSPSTIEDHSLSLSPQKYFNNNKNNNNSNNSNNNSNSLHNLHNDNSNSIFYDDEFSNQFSSSPLKSFASPSVPQNLASPFKFNYQDFGSSSSGSNIVEVPLTPNRSFSDSWIQGSPTLSLSQSPGSELFLTTNNGILDNHFINHNNINNVNNVNNSNNNINNNNNNNNNSDNGICSAINLNNSTNLTNQNNSLKRNKALSLNNIKCKYCNTRMKSRYLSFDEIFFMCGTNGCLYPLDDENMCDFVFPSNLLKKKQKSTGINNNNNNNNNS